MAKDKEYKENANESSSNNTIESKYLVTEFIANAMNVLGVMPEVATGAFYDCLDKELTITQAKNILNKFLTKEAK